MKENKDNAQKNTLLKIAQANAESIFFKRVFFSPPNKSTLPFFTNLFSPTHGFCCNRTDSASNVNPLGQSVCKLETTHLRIDRRASANSTFAIGGVTCFYDTFVVKQTVVLLMNFSAKNPPLRQAANRCKLPKNRLWKKCSSI